MFCLTDINEYEYFNVKCNPEKAIELREQYEEVSPCFHMNKKHWNSIKTNGSISTNQLKEWITDSYNLAIANLPKKIQKELEEEG